MKKLFGKRGIALLTTLALVVSMVAMLGGLTANAEYSPKRAVTFTVSEGIQQSCLMLEDAFKVAAGEKVTVSGYYKVDSITGDKFEIHGGAINVTEPTDGWVEFSVEYDVPTAGEWKSSGFWQASGQFALADITFTKADGTVVYDMATDEALEAGTYEYTKAKGYDKKSLWYLMGAYGTVAEDAKCTVVVDDVYVAPIEVKRAVTFTVSEGIQQSCMMLEDAFKVAAGEKVTVSGYYKVDSISGGSFEVLGGAIKVTEATDGWVEFSVEYDVPTGAQWKHFGFWQASGVFAVADIQFTNAKGEVVYDMATDADLVAGTYEYTKAKGYDKQSLFYLMGAYGTVAEDAKCTVVLDDVYTPPYIPKRAISIDVSNHDANSKFTITKSGSTVGEGKTVTVKGYYKLENFDAHTPAQNPNVNIASGLVKISADTDGWVYFEKPGYVTGDASSNWLSFSFWYADGKLSLADVVFEDENGKVVYDMATDEELLEGSYNSTPIQQGMWYMSHYSKNGNVVATVDPVYVPETYTPTRVISIDVKNNDINSKFTITGSGTKIGEGKTVTVKGYYKLENYAIVDESKGPNVNIASGLEKITADTNGWVYFEKPGYVCGDASANWLSFSFWYATGKLSLADIVFVDENGKVVYDLISDEGLEEGDYNSTPLTQSMWYMSHYSANGNVTVHIDAAIPAEDPCANGHTYIGGVCKFCGAEKEYPTIEGDPNYVPDRVMSIETFGGKNGAAGAAIEGKFLLTRGYFPGHSVVVIKGYYKIDNYREAASGSDYNVQIGAGGGCNPADSYAAKGSTNGWVPFSVKFLPKAQDNTEWDGCAKFGHWYTHGKLSMADVTVESLSGEILYDMRYDETLPTGTTAGGTEFLTEETKGLQTDRWYIGAYGFDDWSDIEVVVTPALEKPVTPPAQTGDVNMIVVVALGAMAAMTLAVVTLNKKKFSV